MFYLHISTKTLHTHLQVIALIRKEIATIWTKLNGIISIQRLSFAHVVVSFSAGSTASAELSAQVKP